MATIHMYIYRNIHMIAYIEYTYIYIYIYTYMYAYIYIITCVQIILQYIYIYIAYIYIYTCGSGRTVHVFWDTGASGRLRSQECTAIVNNVINPILTTPNKYHHKRMV